MKLKYQFKLLLSFQFFLNLILIISPDQNLSFSSQFLTFECLLLLIMISNTHQTIHSKAINQLPTGATPSNSNHCSTKENTTFINGTATFVNDAVKVVITAKVFEGIVVDRPRRVLLL